MHFRQWTGSVLVLIAAAALFASGCGETRERASRDGKADSKHSGWWCDEHGIPEAECSACNKKVEAECKAKGDWCTEHGNGIAKSQCFVCNPEMREKYAAMYRAKYNKEPPLPEENMPKEKAKEEKPKEK